MMASFAGRQDVNGSGAGRSLNLGIDAKEPRQAECQPGMILDSIVKDLKRMARKE
jgi:hypothetical protein